MATTYDEAVINNAVITELEQQRNWGCTRAVGHIRRITQLSLKLAAAQVEIEDLKKQVATLTSSTSDSPSAEPLPALDSQK